MLSSAFSAWKDEISWKHWKKITKGKNDENVLYLKMTGVVLAPCNIVNNDY